MRAFVRATSAVSLDLPSEVYNKHTESSQATPVDIEDEQIPPVQALGSVQNGILGDTEMIRIFWGEKYKSPTSFSRKKSQLHKQYK